MHSVPSDAQASQGDVPVHCLVRKHETVRMSVSWRSYSALTCLASSTRDGDFVATRGSRASLTGHSRAHRSLLIGRGIVNPVLPVMTSGRMAGVFWHTVLQSEPTQAAPSTKGT